MWAGAFLAGDVVTYELTFSDYMDHRRWSHSATKRANFRQFANRSRQRWRGDDMWPGDWRAIDWNETSYLVRFFDGKRVGPWWQVKKEVRR